MKVADLKLLDKLTPPTQLDINFQKGELLVATFSGHQQKLAGCEYQGALENGYHLVLDKMIGDNNQAHIYNNSMKRYFSLLPLLIILRLSISQYVPTFPNLIQTGKLQFTPSGAISPSGLSLTITFSVDKNTTNYAETLSFQNLFLNINNFCYSIRLQSHNKTSNSEVVLITSNCSCILNWVHVRYLIVQPAFTASVQLVQIEQNYPTPKLLQSSSNTKITIISSSFQGDPTSLEPAAILKGITIRNNKNGGNNEYIDFQLTPALAISLFITLSGTSSQTQIYIQSVSLTVILIRKSISIGTVTSYFPISYLLTNSFASMSNATTMYSDSTTFLGIAKFNNRDKNAYLRFEATINSNSVSLEAFNGNTFEIVVINFAFQKCSISSPYFLPANQSCLSVCPSNCQTNFTAFLCAPCALTSCSNGSFLSNNTCLPCNSSCLTCDALLNCTTCNMNYSLVNSSCVLNCTALLNSTAVYRSNTTCQVCPAGCLSCINGSYCSSCTSVRYFDQGSCLLNCSLFFNSSFLLNGSCLSCNSTCSTCLNSSYCLSCEQNYTLDNNTCLLDCSKIRNSTYLSNGRCMDCGMSCLSCVNGSQCSSCNSTFFLDGGNCLPNCTLISNGTFLLNRTCERCSIECASCSNHSFCTACSNNYTLAVNNSCGPDCSLLANCSACTILYSKEIFCIQCSSGYSAMAGVCEPICGDGSFLGDYEEGCDDGNIVNGDGCSSQCRVEPDYWECNSTIGNLSLCKLKNMDINPSFLIKSSNRNSIIVYISVSPMTSIYDGLDWAKGFIFPSGLLVVENAYFDSKKQMIVVEASYTQSLTSTKSLSVVLTSSTITPKLELVPTKTHEINMVAENDLSLQYFTEDAYSVASFIEYYGIIVVCISYVMFLLGYLGGKVVVIEYFSVFQICSLGLLNIGDASPAFGALRVFRFSLGSSFIGQYDYSHTLDRNFKGLYFTLNAFSSLGIVFIIVFLPIIVGALIKVLSLTLCRDKPLMKQLPPFLFCQFAFYGILFSSFLIFAQIAVCFSSLSSGSFDLAMGIVISLLLTFSMVPYGYFLKQTPAYFGPFTKLFIKFGIATYYWIIILCLRLIDSLSLVLLKGNDLALGVELALVTSLFIFILTVRPYVCASYRRQGVNFACTASVLGLEMAGRLVKGSQAVETFLPLVICVIFTIALLANSFYLLQQIKPILASLCASQGKEPPTSSSIVDQLFEITIEPNVESKNQQQFELFERKMMGGDVEQLHLMMKERFPLNSSPLKMDKERLDFEWQNYPVLAKSKMLEEIRFKISAMAERAH